MPVRFLQTKHCAMGRGDVIDQCQSQTAAFGLLNHVAVTKGPTQTFLYHRAKADIRKIWPPSCSRVKVSTSLIMSDRRSASRSMICR